MSSEASAVLVTGIQAAGKSTIGRLLAERAERSAFIEGDLMWKLIVSGRTDMTPDASPEALGQLHLRYRHGAMLVDSLAQAGFTAIHADIVLGEDLSRYCGWVRHRPLRVVVLAPDPTVVVERERARGSKAYEVWMEQGGTLDDAVRRFHQWLASTPALGIRVDTTNQTRDRTVDEILERWDEAVVDL